MQNFKGDPLELKFIESADPVLSALGASISEFFTGAYDAMPLGDLLQVNGRSPLANAIRNEIFRESFNEIYTQFGVSGTFESYLDVFSKIFGSDVDVEFTVPAPGKLDIDITADHLEEFNFVARHIVDDAFVFYNVMWSDDDTGPNGDHILFQSVKGFHSQYELEQMLFEMVPAGIFTTITLTFTAP